MVVLAHKACVAVSLVLAEDVCLIPPLLLTSWAVSSSLGIPLKWLECIFAFFGLDLIGRTAGIGSPDCTVRRLGFGPVVLDVVLAFASALGTHNGHCGITLTTIVLGVIVFSAPKSAGWL